MTFLPIATRELRLAARKRSTFWLRIVAALVALVIGGGFMFVSVLGGASTASLGGMLFSVLTWMAVAVALSAGLFFTSDCLSEEKREGTLGLLFLTDLRGYDVVLGKLMATCLRGFYAVLAVFPILAVTLLMGGVTGPQFWKSVLALVSSVLWSLSAGLVVSSLSRDSQKAMSATLMLLLVFLVGGTLADSLIRLLVGPGFGHVFSLLNPGYVFAMAGAWGQAPFWTGLLLNQLVTALFLATAFVLTPRVWQERPARSAAYSSGVYSLKYGSRRRRLRLRAKLMDVNPMLWLACRERWQALGIWAIALLILAIFGALAGFNVAPQVWGVWGSLSGLCVLLVYLWAASQASRFFYEARQNGLFELLLESPLTVQQIVQGQWRGIVRLFGAPVALCLCAQFGAQIFVQEATWGTVATKAGGNVPSLLLLAGIAVSSTISTVTNLIALVWFGMWMGLTSKRASLATLKTIVFAQIVPQLVIGFVSGILVWLLMMSQFINIGSKPNTGAIMTTAARMGLLMTGCQGLMSVAKDIAFVLWSRKTLYSSFRERVMQSSTLLPAISAPPAYLQPPPVIAPAPAQKAAEGEPFARLPS